MRLGRSDSVARVANESPHPITKIHSQGQEHWTQPSVLKGAQSSGVAGVASPPLLQSSFRTMRRISTPAGRLERFETRRQEPKKQRASKKQPTNKQYRQPPQQQHNPQSHTRPHQHIHPQLQPEAITPMTSTATAQKSSDSQFSLESSSARTTAMTISPTPTRTLTPRRSTIHDHYQNNNRRKHPSRGTLHLP